MVLHITDPRLDELAEQAQKILNAPTKTDAIRQALERVVENGPEKTTEDEKPLAQRVKAIQDEVKRLGTPNPKFDEEAFLDEMWES
jgi:antitoxin VapB